MFKYVEQNGDGGIERSTFIVKYYGSIDFSINKKIAVQELWLFSRQDFDSIKPQSRKFTFTAVGSKKSF